LAKRPSAAAISREYSIYEENAERFDTSGFLNNLKSQIAVEINAPGFHTDGTGSGNDSFYFNYSGVDKKGSIEVIGARLEGNRYKLWCVMRESAITRRIFVSLRGPNP
jgi:hypothetical protein